MLPQDRTATTRLYAEQAREALPASSELRITSDPPGADVLVNDVFVGITPARFTTRKGMGRSFTLSVQKNGYPSWKMESMVRPGQSRLHATLGMAKASGAGSLNA